MSPRKDYSQTDYSGPKLANFERKQATRRKKILLYFGLAVGLYLAVYFFGYSNVFKITEVNIYGSNSIEKEELLQLVDKGLDKRRFLLLKQRNIIFFKSDKLETLINEQFSINKLDIQKKYFHTLNITLDEKIPILVWINERGGYYVDHDGIVTSKVTASQFNGEQVSDDVNILRHKVVTDNIPSVYDLHNKQIVLHQSVTGQKSFERVINLLELIQNKFSIVVDFYNINMPERTLEAVTSEGWKVLYHLDNDLNEQVTNANLLIAEKIPNRDTLEYIDVRFNDRLFYK